MQFLFDSLIIAVVAVVERHVGKRLQTASAILQRQVIVVVPLVVFPRLTGSHQTESVALRFQCLDAYNSIHLGIVFRTRGGNHVYALDVCRLQFLQVAHVAYLLIVNIDLGLALGQHFELTVLTLHHGDHRQQVVGIADVVKQ